MTGCYPIAGALRNVKGNTSNELDLQNVLQARLETLQEWIHANVGLLEVRNGPHPHGTPRPSQIMNQPLLILDCHYLCHRAFHAQQDLSWNGIATGVIFGFLKSIGVLKNEFATDRIGFCFEGTTLWRKTWFPEYKMKRQHHERETDPEKVRARGDLCRQIDALRTRHLPLIGFKNIFYYPGYESDDLMAKFAETEKGDVVLVTSDADLFQCLRPNVSIWDPNKKRLFTDKWFRKEYGIDPWRWAMVKAIAGCGSDGVPGIPGVGEITALKFIRGELKHSSKAWASIMSDEGKRVVLRNRKLVELPFKDPDTPLPELHEDNVKQDGWNEVCKSLGIRSLMDRAPIYSRRY